MKNEIRYNTNSGEYCYLAPAWDEYIEIVPAQPSSRVLDGSQDHGYDCEYVGRGTVDGIPVRAIYLFAEGGTDDEDPENWDWEAALRAGRLVVDVDALTEAQYTALVEG